MKPTPYVLSSFCKLFPLWQFHFSDDVTRTFNLLFGCFWACSQLRNFILYKVVFFLMCSALCSSPFSLRCYCSVRSPCFLRSFCFSAFVELHYWSPFTARAASLSFNQLYIICERSSLLFCGCLQVFKGVWWEVLLHMWKSTSKEDTANQRTLASACFLLSYRNLMDL